MTYWGWFLRGAANLFDPLGADLVRASERIGDGRVATAGGPLALGDDEVGDLASFLDGHWASPGSFLAGTENILDHLF